MIPDPGGRAPAPGRLRLVQAFVNTRDIENVVDELADPEALRAILVDLDVLAGDAPPLHEADLHLALEALEALRALALANSGVPLPADAATTLERVARAAHYTLRFEPGESRGRLEPSAPGLDGALGRILAVVHDAMTDGSWRRLKACPRDVCHWVFYDRSRNGSGTWCAMSVCGNRTNTRRYRRRRTTR